MRESDALSLLIGDIYDAALDRSLWPNVLEKSCAFVGGSSANLFFHDTSGKSAAVYFQWGNDPHYEQLYIQQYATLNPLFPGMTVFDVGEVYSQSDIIPYTEYLATRFYQEWARPQSLVDVVAVTLEKSATSVAMLAIRRRDGDGLVDHETRRRMGLIAPHVRRAVLIGNVINFHEAAAVTLTETLAGLADGIFLVDAKARIIFANTAGQAMLGSGNIVRSTQSALTTTDPTATEMLHDVFGATSSGDDAVGTKGIAVPLHAAGGEHWLAHVLPLTSGARKHAGSAAGATAAVFLRQASLEGPSATEALSRLYKLTPTELRVLLAVVQIGGGPAVAEALGISETTVKTHLQNLFEKTGARRQADLVKLVAGASSPFA